MGNTPSESRDGLSGDNAHLEFHLLSIPTQAEGVLGGGKGRGLDGGGGEEGGKEGVLGVTSSQQCLLTAAL